MNLEELTIDDILESAEQYGLGPEQTAQGVQRWRSHALKFGSEKLKDDPVKYWEASASVEKDAVGALTQLRQKAKVNDALSEDPVFHLDRVPPVTLQAEGQDLATMALKDRGDNTWEALVMPLKEGGKPFALQIPKPTPEQLKARVDKAQQEYDTLAEAADAASKDPSITESETLDRSLREKDAELELLKSGDMRTLALMDGQKLIKADDAKLGQIAETSKWDRIKAGAMTAAVGTGRAAYAYGLPQILTKGQPDPFEGFEESLAASSKDTARAFEPTTGDKMTRGALESAGQMATTVLPAGAATRIAGGIVSELGAASAMGPMSAGQEWSQMIEMANEARARGQAEKADQIESVARWSGLTQGAIDVLTEGTFGETARAFRGGKQALTNLVTAPAKEAVEEMEAGVAERGVKQPAFYPQEKVQPTFEGTLVEAGAGALAGGGMTAVQTVAGTGVNAVQRILRKPSDPTSLEAQRTAAVAAAPDVATAQVLDEVYDEAADWDALGGQPPSTQPITQPPDEVTPPTEPPILDVSQPVEPAPEEPPVPPEGSALAAPADQVASDTGEATGSTAPPVSTEDTVKSESETATPTFDLQNLRRIAASPSMGETALRAELNAHSPEERAQIASMLGAKDDLPATLAKALKFEQLGDVRYSLANDPQRTPTVSVRDLKDAKGGYSPATGEVFLDEKSLQGMSPEERAMVVRHELAHKIETETELWQKSDTFLWDLWEKNRNHPIFDFMSETTGRVRFDNSQSPEIIAQLYATEYPKGTFTVKERVNLSEGEQESEWNEEGTGLKPREYPIPNELMDVLKGIEAELGIWKKKQQRTSRTRYSVSAPAAQPISQERAQRVVAQTFNGRTPNNVTFINDPNARTPQGQMWAGQADRATGRVTINLAAVQDEADLANRVKEEALHLVWQDPKVQGEVAALQGAVTPEMIAEVEKMGYSLGEQPEEAAVRLVQQLAATPDGRSLMRRIVDAIKNAFRRLFRMEPSAQQVQAAARKVMSEALAGRATQGEGVRFSLAEVFGEETAQPTKGDSYKAAELLAKQVYFDGGQPVTPAATDEAWTKALNWGPAVVGQLLEAGKGTTNTGEDSVAIVGKAQVQLYRYAYQLLKAGDPSLHQHIMIHAPKWTQVVDQVLISGDVGALLGSRVSGLETSATMLAANKTGESREAAEQKNLPKGLVDEIDTEVSKTKLDPVAVRRVKRGARKPDGKTLEDTVEDLEATPEAEVNRNTRTAQSILDQLAKLQSDTPSLTDKQIDPVRNLIRQALAPKAQFERAQLIAALQALEVSSPTAEVLTEAVWTQRRHNAEVTVAKAQRALAEGTRGSLKPLEDALINAPALQQQSPVWRHNTALRYFQQLGLNPQQAAAAARLYNKEFTARLQEALEGAIEKVARTRAPWMQRVSAAVRKRAKTDLDKLRDAVRTGVAKPGIEWHTDLAKSNGWQGFTPAQFERLTVIDAALADETVPEHKKAELKTEVSDMTRRAGLPPSVMDYIAASFNISALTGLPTAFIQFAGPVNILYRYLNDLLFNPVVATKAYVAAMGTFVAEARKGARTGVFTEQVNETLYDAMDPLKDLFERGMRNYEKGGAAAALGVMQIIVGAQQAAGRMMNTIDQASYGAAKFYSHTLFTARELKSAGWTREDAALAVFEAMTGRQNMYDMLTLSGSRAGEAGPSMRPDEALLTANEEFARAAHELEALAIKQDMLNKLIASGTPKAEAEATVAASKIEPVLELIASNEALGPLGRLGHLPFDVQEGKTTRAKGTAIQELDDGFFRRIGGFLIVGLNALLKKGGSSIIIGRSTVGYFAIPFRAAVWTSNYTGYGFVRYLHDRWRTRGGAFPERSPYKQSFATTQQRNQRMIDATMGSLLMVAATQLRGSSGDDDPDKSELKFIFTGKGPNDPVQRQAWLKRFAPYSMTIKVGKTYTPFNTTRMFESLGWQLAVAGALDDRDLNRQRGLLKAGEKAELIGAYIGSLTMRSSFQGLSKDLGNNSAEITKNISHGFTFAASGIVPWKGAMMSINRLLDDPPDRKTMTGMIQANTPWLYLAGKPALNAFGDVLRDDTLAGKAYREGVPLIPRFPTSEKDRVVYDLVLKHGKGPSIVDAGDVERYGQVLPEQLYEYGKIRGQMMKAEIVANASKWNGYDRKQYDRALERMARRINPKAAKAAGLKRVPK